MEQGKAGMSSQVATQSAPPPVLAESGPLYANLHQDAVIALVRIRNYEELVLRSEARSLVQQLHRFHLIVDEHVERYGLYKVDSKGGEITIAANVSTCIDDPCHKVLEFSCEVMKALSSLKTPLGSALMPQVAISTGTVMSAVLGRSGLRYGVHGPPDTLVRRLVNGAGESRIVASKDFVAQLSGDLPWIDCGGVELPAGCTQKVTCYALMPYADEKYLAEDSSGGVVENENEEPTLSSWSLLFRNQRLEKRYRFFQVERVVLIDLLYLTLALVMIQTIVWRTWERGFSFTTSSVMAFGTIIFCMATTLGPMIAIMCAKEFYLHHRQKFLVCFRASRILGFFLHNLLAPNVMLGTPDVPFLSRILVMNSALLHGMHSVGAQVSLPVHVLLQSLALVAVWVCNLRGCGLPGNEVLAECSKWLAVAAAGVCQLAVVVVVPTILIYKIESMQRAAFAGMQNQAKKQN
ncbi:hypothetical protein BSKO_04324 [Bryopsis sp. KO-2023]|nr:hypothetical protein BSKO_04324 [Bryopsis sp. KO-2023]